MKRCHAVAGRIRAGRSAPGMTRAFIAALCLSVFVCGPALAEEEDGANTAEEVTLGIASAILTVPYGAGKMVYAGLGGIIGGVSWALSGGNTDTAKSIWDASLQGTYVITPDHLQGRKPVRFVGPAASGDAAASADDEHAP